MPHSHDHSGHAGNNENKSSGGNWLSSRTGVIVIVAVSILGLLIYTGNGQQLLGYWPLLLIGLCVGSHFFMHGGHGGHGGHRHTKEEDTSSLTPEERKKREEEKKQHKHSHGGC